MTQTNIYEEWQKLCEEHDAASDEYFGAQTALSKKFSRVAQGTSTSNPSETVLHKLVHKLGSDSI